MNKNKRRHPKKSTVRGLHKIESQRPAGYSVVMTSGPAVRTKK